MLAHLGPYHHLLVLGLVIIAGALLGCGAASSPVVVRIGPTKLTKAELDRWTAIEAAVVYNPNPHTPVPAGAIPDPPSYSRCVRYLGVSAARSRGPVSTPLLRRQCRTEHEVLQHQILEILITSRWLTTEAATRGVRVSDAEARRVLREKFPTKTALRNFLAFTGEKEADELFLLERVMLANRFGEWFRHKAASPAQAEQAQIGFFSGMVATWKARTRCSAGYVVSQCREYHAR